MDFKAVNQKFYDSARAFVTAGLSLVVEYLNEGGKVPSRIVQKSTIQGSSCHTDYVERPDLWLLVFKLESRLQSLPEYTACVDIMKADYGISRHIDCLVGTWNMHSCIAPGQYLNVILVKQLNHFLEKTEFDLQTFESAYSDLEYFFYNDKIPTLSFAPLHNFVMEVEEIDLGCGLQIRKMKNQEREALLDSSSTGSSHFGILSIKYAIEFNFLMKKMFGDLSLPSRPISEENYHEIISELITALRLFKSGIIGINTISTKHTIDLPFGSMISSGLVDEVLSAQSIT